MTEDQGVLIIVESKLRRRDDEPTEPTGPEDADDTIQTVIDEGRFLEDDPAA